MKAGKAVYRQMERIVKALLRLSADKDSKTYSESRTLLTAICNMEFIFRRCVLKVILSNTNNLCRYLQRSTVGVISARWNADRTAEQKMYASFRLVRGLGYLMTVSEMLETMHENDPFDMFSDTSYLVHIPAVIPATSRSAQRSFSALRRLKTYLRSTWVNNVSVTSQLLKGHMPPL